VPNLCRVADLAAHVARRGEGVVAGHNGCGRCDSAFNRTRSDARLGGGYRRWSDEGSTSARAS
jgi:hypothetical protein